MKVTYDMLLHDSALIVLEGTSLHRGHSLQIRPLFLSIS